MNLSGKYIHAGKAAKCVEELMENHLNRLLNHAYYHLGNLKDAEDVVQETLLKVFIEIQRKKILKNPPAYTFRMLSNACIDKMRKTRKQFIPIENIITAEIPLTNTPEEELIRHEEYLRINNLLNSIPADQAEVIRFRFVVGMQFAEIAEILEIPETTAKSRFAYGIKKIKEGYFYQKPNCHELFGS
jgi:RNA polymerase sigma-70 factor, ECF subfamily